METKNTSCAVFIDPRRESDGCIAVAVRKRAKPIGANKERVSSSYASSLAKVDLGWEASRLEERRSCYTLMPLQSASSTGGPCSAREVLQQTSALDGNCEAARYYDWLSVARAL